ncbi:MAG TPA: hypothetical protein VKX49_19250 [Bryobacteraceae bacterium]|nr:hypothetical protein [Bryobacteraceae bacterium]
MAPQITSSTNRAQGVSDQEAGLKTRLIFWFVKRKLKRLPLGVRIRAHDPKLLELSGRMDMHVAASQTVPAILKELAQIKVAAMVGCPF